MAYCINCGTQLAEGAKYCQKCGKNVSGSAPEKTTSRVIEFEGKLYKCPNCGENLQSFVRNCPACGLEIRGTKPASSVREFALKLEAIEARRDSSKKSILSKLAEPNGISSTDAQKASLIKSFSVPNTREDILEFMILATANINLRVYDSMSKHTSKSDEAVNDAWLSKTQQVYEKTKLSYGAECDFQQQVEALYNKCLGDITKAKKKNVVKYVCMLAAGPILLLLLVIFIKIMVGSTNEKEEARLEAIVVDVETAMAAGDYRLALRTAESIEYRAGNSERARWWGIKRETLIDEIIETAEENGVHLERTEIEENPEPSSEGIPAAAPG